MATVANDLLDQLMQLSRDDKKFIVRHLLDALLDEPEEGWAEAWEAELIKRQRDIDEGRVKMIPLEEAKLHFQRRFQEKRS